MKLRRLELSMNALASTFPSRVLYAEGEPETLEQKDSGKGPQRAHTLDADMQARVVWVDDESFIPFEMIALGSKAREPVAPKLAAGSKKR